MAITARRRDDYVQPIVAATVYETRHLADVGELVFGLDNDHVEFSLCRQFRYCRLNTIKETEARYRFAVFKFSLDPIGYVVGVDCYRVLPVLMSATIICPLVNVKFELQMSRCRYRFYVVRTRR